MQLDLIDSVSKETNSQKNQQGSECQSQSNRGAELQQTPSATGGERKEDGGDGDGEDEKRRKKTIPGDAVSVDEKGEEGEEEEDDDEEEDSTGKITNTTTLIMTSNYSQVKSLAAPGGRRSQPGHWTTDNTC